MKEGKKRFKSQVKQVQKNFELDIVNFLKKGLNPSKIAVQLNVSLSNLSYYLSSLKSKGIIKRIGYGVWEVDPTKELQISSHKGGSQVKDVRGHAFIWKVKANKNFDWLKLLQEKNIKYELKGISNTPRIILSGKKIWLGSNYISIFEPKWNSYFARNPVESKKEAIWGMIESIEELKKITGDFNYKFACRRQHYGFVNNPEAMFFIKQGKKILIKNEKGYWFTIDFSQNQYKEAETIHEEDAMVDGLGYQRLMNSHERTRFKVTPEFTLEVMNGIQSNQLIFDKNMKSHLEVLSQIGKAVGELKEEVKKLQDREPKVI